jgi:hypothetical protein
LGHLPEDGADVITDLVLSIAHSIYAGLVGFMPDMPARPAALDEVRRLFAWSAYLLPYDEIVAFVPILLVTMGGLALWRIVRLLLPGG